MAMFFDCVSSFLPGGGRVLIENQEVNCVLPKVSVLFQDASLFDWKTVYANVEFPLKNRKILKSERKPIILNLLRELKLTGFENYYPFQLSGGMKHRVALARVLAYQPEFLLMDEPFCSLDARLRESFQADFSNLFAASKISVLFITHDIEEALFMGDSVLLMTSLPGESRNDLRFLLRDHAQ